MDSFVSFVPDREILLKPAERLVGDLLKGSRFFEQMTGSWNDHELLNASEVGEGFLVHFNHWAILSSYEQ